MAWEKKGSLKPWYLKPGYQKLWHGSDFIYTKISARPGSGFYLHKELARPGSGFYLHKFHILKEISRCAGLEVKKSYKKTVCILKNFPAARAKKSRKFTGDDVTENDDFQIGNVGLQGAKNSHVIMPYVMMS